VTPDDVILDIRGLHKAYHKRGEQPVPVLADLTLQVRTGEFVTLFGPNGCGKTTLLNIVAGFTSADSGVCDLRGSSSTVAFIFQNYSDSLLPWRTLLSNIALPLELKHVALQSRTERVRAVLDFLGLELPLDSYPYQVSSGQQQMAAIARALLTTPRLLLMDEPFASLDYQTRIRLQDKLLEIWQKTGVTVLFVSHEVDEAVYLGQRVALLSKRPAHVIRVFESQLELPRSREMERSPAFLSLRADLLDAFQQEVA
jgi:NitT/TauT family transport system ATP-binding protein